MRSRRPKSRTRGSGPKSEESRVRESPTMISSNRRDTLNVRTKDCLMNSTTSGTRSQRQEKKSSHWRKRTKRPSCFWTRWRDQVRNSSTKTSIWLVDQLTTKNFNNLEMNSKPKRENPWESKSLLTRKSKNMRDWSKRKHLESRMLNDRITNFPKDKDKMKKN